jgi:pre-mRNA-splicing factor 18
MDFKSLMAAQISKAKSPASNSAVTISKYQRRAAIEAERQAAYTAEQARQQEEREERAAKKRKLEEEDAEKTAEREAKLKKLAAESKVRREAQEREEERARRKRLGLPELPDTKDEDLYPALGGGEDDIIDDQLRSNLRDLDEPVTLYDESHAARLRRYYALTRKALAPRLSNGPIPTTLDLVEEKDMLLPEKVPEADTKDHTFLYRQLASYFTLLLTEWARDLNARDEDTKESSTGRAAHTAHLNVMRELTPLFRKLESRTLDPSLLAPLCDIVRYAQHRQYVKANDTYLTLAIGKAAWPIGVTMVGIHERSAREKLHEQDKQAHIMSDEVTRKMLQSVKRCLSYAQTRWPPADLGQLMG